ncbi:MAG: DNA adenine methylase [Candidatus Methanofastidiosa archaeon]|nr:DNA adenine methylase [Candidatus Methanofastidiosa archaeon]
MSQAVSQWLGKIENDLPKAVERLKTVQIENMDYKDLIKKYDGKDTLFYLDPPYIHKTRQMTYQYTYEMTDQQHEEMINILLHIKGKAILSGYDNEIYNKLLDNGWRKMFLGEYDKRNSYDMRIRILKNIEGVKLYSSTNHKINTKFPDEKEPRGYYHVLIGCKTDIKDIVEFELRKAERNDWWVKWKEVQRKRCNHCMDC